MATAPWTETDLKAMLDAGLLVEDHHRDLKRELAKHLRLNTDLAKDLAAFAVDGGTIYIGVKEHDNDGPASLHPVPLQGLKERVDQIARQTPRPPVAVRCEEVRCAQDPDTGYLIVTIPPSPDAPHMVDGRYMGRGDTTNHFLQDHEVVRLHTRRDDNAVAARSLLAIERERDPSPKEWAGQAHLYVAAQPIHHDDELLINAIDQPLNTWVNKHILQGLPGRNPGTYEPDIGSTGGQISSRAGAVAIHSYDVGPGRILGPEARESSVVDLEVREDGGVRLFCSRGSDDHRGRVVIMPLVWGLTKRVVLTAAEISTATEFLGTWSIGVLLDRAHGVTPYDPDIRQAGTYPAYSEPTYQRTAILTSAELVDEPSAVVDSLLGRFGRSLRHTMSADDLPF